MTKRRPSTQSRAERLLSLTTVWPVCYSTLVVIVHSYLIYQAVSRYKIYATAAPGEAGYHLVLLCIAALLLPVIVLLSFVKTGTYTNDGAPCKFNYRDVVNSFLFGVQAKMIRYKDVIGTGTDTFKNVHFENSAFGFFALGLFDIHRLVHKGNSKQGSYILIGNSYRYMVYYHIGLIHIMVSMVSSFRQPVSAGHHANTIKMS